MMCLRTLHAQLALPTPVEAIASVYPCGPSGVFGLFGSNCGTRSERSMKPQLDVRPAGQDRFETNGPGS